MMNRRGFLRGIGAVAASAALVAATGVSVPTAAPKGYQQFGPYSHATMLPASAGVVERGGVIRFTSAGPKLHVNPTHNSIGLIPKSVSITYQGDLYVKMDRLLPIVDANVTPDETLVTRDIKAGLSGGGDYFIIRFSDKNGRLNLRWPSHYKRIMGETSNVWVGITSYYAG